MSSKEPVLLTVLIETRAMRWYLAGVGLNGEALPLMCSPAGNLEGYVGASFAEQVSFLRHRLAGVLQRGCDRLWGQQKKPCQIAFLADDRFDRAPPELTDEVAAHFVQWMVSPPVVFFLCEPGFAIAQPIVLHTLAGDIERAWQHALEQSLPNLLDALPRPERWEMSLPSSPGA